MIIIKWVGRNENIKNKAILIVLILIGTLFLAGCTSEEVSAVKWNNRGIALSQQEKYNEAIECFDKAIAADPDYKLAWYNKGAALREDGRYPEAVEAYNKAIELDPNFAEA